MRMRNKLYFFMFFCFAIISLYLISVLKVTTPFISVEVVICGEEKTINSWYDSESRTYAIALPQYVSEEDLEVKSDYPLYVDGKSLDGKWLLEHANSFDEEFLAETKDTLLTREYRFHVYQTKNTGSLFVSTAGGIKTVIKNKNKNKKEPIAIVAVDEAGNIDYSGADCVISGHGNSTWYRGKRPFEIKAEAPFSLYGKKDSTEWVLLANSFDIGSLRNHLAFEGARELGMEYVVDESFVDLFIDGDYYGLYQVTQSPKAIFASEDKNQSGVLFSSEMEDRLSSEKIHFELLNKNYALVKYASNSELINSAIEWVLEADRIVSDESDTKGDKLESVIDVHQWASKYLIDEMYENYDAGITSNYFYTDESRNGDKRVYAGPVWDYDNSIGNTKALYGTTDDPKILYLANGVRSDMRNIVWYKNLIEKEIFKDDLISIYKNSFRQIVMDQIKEIDEWSEYLGKSAQISAIRYGKELDYEVYSQALKDYLSQRLEFLDDIWINGTKYNSVIVARGGEPYYIYYLKDGEKLSNNEFFCERDNGNNLVEVNTLEKLDIDKPVYEDKFFNPQKTTKDKLIKILRDNKKTFIILFSFGMFAVFLLGLLLLSNKQKIRGRVSDK